MRIRFRFFLLVLDVTVWNLTSAAPQPVVVSPTASTLSSTTISSTGVDATLPPAGGQMTSGGVGGQFSSTRLGEQFIPGSSPGGQLAPGQIPGGTVSGLIPTLPAFNPYFAANFGQTFNQSGKVIVTGNSLNTTAPGGMISGNGLGGNSRVIVAGNATVAPGGALSGNGVGGGRVIVTGAGAGNTVTAPSRSNVIVTGNTLTGAGVGGTNSVPVLR